MNHYTAKLKWKKKRKLKKPQIIKNSNFEIKIKVLFIKTSKLINKN